MLPDNWNLGAYLQDANKKTAPWQMLSATKASHQGENPEGSFTSALLQVVC